MTAEEFLDRITEDKGDDMENIYHAMREFAKYHVQKALEEVSKTGYQINDCSSSRITDKTLITESYPIESIK